HDKISAHKFWHAQWDRSTLHLFPSAKKKHSHGYSRKSYEVSEFQTHYIKVFELKYQEYRCYYEEHVEEVQESSQMSPLAEYIKKNLHSPSYAGESDANKSPPSSPRSMSSYSVAPVMVTNTTTIEEQLSSLTRAIEGLTKHVQEQDAQIARLINKADNVDASHVMGKQLRLMIKWKHLQNNIILKGTSMQKSFKFLLTD
ncbi:UNVERIFIED_CONTAM: hypothetical protein Sangu_2621200, partial [Sesamum angustifolium]